MFGWSRVVRQTILLRVEGEKKAVITELNMEKVHSNNLEQQNERLQKAYDTLRKEHSDLTTSMQHMQQWYVFYPLQIMLSRSLNFSCL